MIELRELTDEDKETIYRWPTYPSDCLELDYAVRRDGWIDHHSSHGRDRIYSALQGGEVIGFSIVHVADDGDAEFLIAIRGDRLGLGLGRELTLATLQRCFVELGLAKVKLVVRKSNHRAQGLYRKVGFTYTGDCVININGEDIEFYNMEMENRGQGQPLGGQCGGVAMGRRSGV
jgi:ribosomal protein S18 acetylase RimI-like enzyme